MGVGMRKKSVARVWLKASLITVLGLLLACGVGIGTWYVLSGPPTSVAAPPRSVPDVPFVPTPHDIVMEMLKLAEVGPNDVVYDLGCGDGRIVVAAAKHFGARAVGVDKDPRRVAESLENVKTNGVEDKVTIIQDDLFNVDLGPATVITMYLLPSVNNALLPRLEKLKPGTRIVSHDFDIDGVIPKKVLRVRSSESHREHTIYFWVVPFEKEGIR